MRTALIPNPNAADGVQGDSNVLEAFSENTVYVNASTGSDSTGRRERADLPFATLTAAQAAAITGDTINVAAGTYLESNLGKNGVAWYLEDGAVLGSKVTPAVPPFFRLNALDTLVIRGRGSIYAEDSGGNGPIFYCGNNCTITVECKDIFYVGSSQDNQMFAGSSNTSFDVTADLIEVSGDCLLANDSWTFRRARMVLSDPATIAVGGNCYMENVRFKGNAIPTGGVLRIIGSVLSTSNLESDLDVVGVVTIDAALP